MSDNQPEQKIPVSVVRFGMGKEIRLYPDALVVTGLEQAKELYVPLNEIRRLTLMPGEPNPSKLVLMADMDDDTSIVLAEGMTNAKDFRALLPQFRELCPAVELDPPDMEEQLRQALNSKRAWSLTCYGTIVLLCIFLYILYMVVTFIGSHH